MLVVGTLGYAVVGCTAEPTEPAGIASAASSEGESTGGVVGAGSEASVRPSETDTSAPGTSLGPAAPAPVTPSPVTPSPAPVHTDSTASDSADRPHASTDEDASATPREEESTTSVENTNGHTDVDGGTTEPVSSGQTSSGERDGVVGIIGVGYGGLRVVSRDLGQTWTNEVHWTESGGDDFELLRTIAYGNGRWVSGGWQMTTSEDGVNWTDRGASEDVISAVNCQITDGLAFGNGIFLAACGSSLASSTDGLEWTEVGDTPDVGGHPYLFFDPATSLFGCSGDDGASFVSTDGTSWQSVAYDTVHLCASGLTSRGDCPSFFHAGTYLTAEWGGKIKRSTDGERWDTVYSDQFDNNLFTEYAFAVGRVAP